jgi:hypothetical protein
MDQRCFNTLPLLSHLTLLCSSRSFASTSFRNSSQQAMLLRWGCPEEVDEFHHCIHHFSILYWQIGAQDRLMNDAVVSCEIRVVLFQPCHSSSLSFPVKAGAMSEVIETTCFGSIPLFSASPLWPCICPFLLYVSWVVLHLTGLHRIPSSLCGKKSNIHQKLGIITHISRVINS